jgi:hypothetical protein
MSVPTATLFSLFSMFSKRDGSLKTPARTALDVGPVIMHARVNKLFNYVI